MKRSFLTLLVFFVTIQLFASLNVYFVDVGQGDAIVINADEHWAIIDGGDTDTSSKLYTYINNTLNVSNFELVALTHADKDHVGGLSGAIQGKITRKTVVWCNSDASDRYFLSFKDYIETSGSKLTSPFTNDTFTLGSAILTVLSPMEDFGNKNDNSLVIRLEYNGKVFLFMGDASWTVENSLINKYAKPNDFGLGFSSSMLKVDVLKVGHHGSRESTSIYFLECLEPKMAIISVGKGNSYGHPKEDTLSRLIQQDVEIYRTDFHGDVIVSVSEKGILSICTQKNGGKPWFDENLLSSYQKKQRGLI